MGLRHAVAVAALVLVAACGSEAATSPSAPAPTTMDDTATPTTLLTVIPPDPTVTTAVPATDPPPPAADPLNVYAHTTPADIAPVNRDIPQRVYVPNSRDNTVSVIDQETMEVVDTFGVAEIPHHVTPSWDMTVLYVNNTAGNTLTPIDPRTGTRGDDFRIHDPYNLYFTPDGTMAIVVAERDMELHFRDPVTWEMLTVVSVPYAGVNHLDFSADGSYLIASCEFSGWVVKVDLERREVTSALEVGGEPIDVKLAPDGQVFYVANQTAQGVHIIDGESFTEVGFIPTGDGTHGLYVSRDARHLYASNRLAGTVTVIDFATRQAVAEWSVGGSPDMGGVSIDGTRLWLSSRYHGGVMVIDTADGNVVRTIPTGSGPHGLAVWPQPGRYSIGHTGNSR